MKEINIAIVGSCIVRDVFRVADNPKYRINCYLQSISALAYNSPTSKLLQNITSDTLQWGSNFQKRCFNIETIKDVKPRLSQTPADYLLIDMADIRLSMVNYFDGDESYLVPMSKACIHNRPIINKIMQDYNNKVIYPSDFSKEHIKKSVEKLLNDFLQLFNPPQIILIENAMGNFYYDEKGRVYSYKNKFKHYNLKETNDLIQYALTIAKNYLGKDAHFIPFPKNALCDKTHVWGHAPLHYDESAYRYMYNMIDYICDRKDFDKNICNNLLHLAELPFDYYKKAFKAGKAVSDNKAVGYRKKYQSVINSKTYKLGNFLLYIPKRIKAFKEKTKKSANSK